MFSRSRSTTSAARMLPGTTVDWHASRDVKRPFSAVSKFGPVPIIPAAIADAPRLGVDGYAMLGGLFTPSLYSFRSSRRARSQSAEFCH